MKRNGSKRMLKSARVVSVAGLSWALAACGGDLFVGDPPEDTENDTEKIDPNTPPPPYVGSGECAGEDERERSQYETWRRTMNDFSTLAGTSWSGTLLSDASRNLSKTLRLDIALDQTATVTFGDADPPAAATKADEGYLCNGPTFECVIDTDGVPYPVHGALLDGKQLILSLLSTSPWTEWCALQTPHVWKPDTSPCSFETAPNLAVKVGEDRTQCWAYEDGMGGASGLGGEAPTFTNDQLVDCSWAKMLIYDGTYCDCSSDGCFPSMNDDGVVISFTISEDGQALSGILPDSRISAQGTIELTRVD